MESTAPKPFVFVLMPFESKFDDVYELGIKAACQEAGTYCERLDKQIFHENMLGRIYNQISKADIIVADMSEKNPNVFYESGYAHALDKPVIHLTQQGTDIPFDLKHYPHIIYSSISELKNELARKITYFANQHILNTNAYKENYSYYANGQEIVAGSVIKTKAHTAQGLLNSTHVNIQVLIHNDSNFTVENTQITIALKTGSEICPTFDEEYEKYNEYKYIKAPGQHSFFYFTFNQTMFPDQWATKNGNFWVSGSNVVNPYFDVYFIIYHKHGYITIPCKIFVEPEYKR